MTPKLPAARRLRPRLEPVGPAQSEYLIHFCRRPPGTSTTPTVPANIARMTAPERLNRILAEERLLGFAPFGAPTPVICFSESPPDQMAHLIADRHFAPWGIVIDRTTILASGGGSVAYLPRRVADTFPEKLRHWVVSVETDGVRRADWTHEREWRLPAPVSGDDGHHYRSIPPGAVTAVLVGFAGWQPRPMVSSSIKAHPESSEPYVSDEMVLPDLWLTAERWVWNAAARTIEKQPPLRDAGTQTVPAGE
ncbi:hypothetical protein [Streptomyces sp. NPDC001380]|uniref:hypothetical protein n=1 Tax=Streptomyces sp. NPDC001380 TaxID=3364566 RepID=UPI0036AD16F7